MELYDVVIKLVGPIRPIGETHEDDRSFENLKVLLVLMDRLMSDINKIAKDNVERTEFSMRRAGEICDTFLGSINDWS